MKEGSGEEVEVEEELEVEDGRRGNLSCPVCRARSRRVKERREGKEESGNRGGRRGGKGKG